MAMLYHYFEPTSILNLLLFLPNIFCMLYERLNSHRAMAPPPISIFGSPLEQRGKAAIISRLVLHVQLNN